MISVARTYREDIDWLRAIAVLAVLGFHWDIPPFKGGYVGVDLFFVISGFLITQIIQSELKNDTFSFARFYERRVRRLLPALYAMIVLIVIPAFFYLLASERLQFFRSITAVVTFTSNFFFWMQAGYFEGASGEKPLLHTWSLAVEEQFYLVLPLLIWGLLRTAKSRRSRTARLALGLGMAGLASFAMSVWLIRTDRSATAFFMSPPRAWEFLIGAMLAIEGLPILRNEASRQIVRGIAVVMIAIPVFAYRQGTSFPGLNALLPCAGAAVFIWCGTGGTTKHLRPRWLLNGVGVIGRMSYSLYLWHWPLFTFAKFSKPTLMLSAFDKVLLLALALGISYVSYRLIEQPVRRRVFPATRKSAFALAAAISVTLLAAAIVADSTGLADGDKAASKIEAYTHYDYQPVYRFGSCFVEASGTFDDASCLHIEPGKASVLIWGDSLAAHYYHGLRTALAHQNVNLLQATLSSCFPTLRKPSNSATACDRVTALMGDFLRSAKLDTVMISADWLEAIRTVGFDATIADIQQTVAFLRTRGIKVVLVGPTLEFRSPLAAILARAAVRGTSLPPLHDLLLPNLFETDARMKLSLPSGDGFTYVSMLDLTCPDQKCPLTLAGDVPIVWDHAHLTAEGSDYVAARIVGAVKLNGG
jgi:peptidoglycan/LPS O-acetylase OafA/YrhL